MSKLEEFVAARKEYVAQIASKGKEALAEAFTSVFTAHPEIRAIGWTQYTPYFNDGEPCVFDVHIMSFSVVDVDPKNVTSVYEEPWVEAYGTGSSLFAVVRELHRSLPSDVLEAAFGDHVMVIATPAGFHVTEYSHD